MRSLILINGRCRQAASGWMPCASRSLALSVFFFAYARETSGYEPRAMLISTFAKGGRYFVRHQLIRMLRGPHLAK